MRILYIIDFFHPHVGGVPTFFKNLAENAKRMGHSVTVVTTHANGTRSPENYKGMRIYRFGRTREQFMVGATLFLIRNREKFDIVHTSTYSAMVPSYAFSVMKNVPQVLSVHEVWTLNEWMEFTKSKGMFYFLEERMLFSLPFDAYISPSAHTKHDIERMGVPSSKIKVIPHGIDRSVFSPAAKRARRKVRREHLLDENEIVGCFVGKATVFKGVDYLLDALEGAMSKSGSLRFVFLLSRLHESGYKKFIERVNGSDVLRRNIVVVEASKDSKSVAELVAASDFLVMPSLTEGFGFAAAEAASMGIPVIATKDTSLTEVVEEGKHAMFVSPRDSKNIEKAILALTESKSLRSKLSKGRRYKTWPEVSREYVKVYQDVIRKHKEAGK